MVAGRFTNQETRARLLEKAELSDEEERKLEREFSRQYHIITFDERLEKIAEDIVSHLRARLSRIPAGRKGFG